MATGTAPPRLLSQKEADVQMMLAADVHLGTKNCNFQMECYIFKRRSDGIYIINLGKTWEKLQLATRVIVAIENPQDIIVQSARPYGQRAVLKFAQNTGAHAIAGRHMLSRFTNQLRSSFNEPCLLILTDPRMDHLVASTSVGFVILMTFWCFRRENESKRGRWCLTIDDDIEKRVLVIYNDRVELLKQ